MKISVVTICYNSEDCISTTIESVLRQKAEYVEYLIVDGYSSDNTVGIAKKYEGDFKNKGWSYRIISEKDDGIYDAMNKGVRNASGDIVGILNSGDWYEDCALEQIEKLFSRNEIDYCYGDMYVVKQNGKKKLKKSKIDKHPTSRHWNHPTMFVKKSVYEKYGFYRCVGIHDDFDFFLRLKRNGAKVSIINIPLASFALGGVSNKKSIKKSISRIKDRYRCYRDNNYSRFYIFECIFMEIVKFLIA